LTVGFVTLGIAAAAAAVGAVTAWLATAWPFALAAVAIAAIAVAFEDVWTMIQGGDSVLGRLIDHWFPGMHRGLSTSQLYGLALAETFNLIGDAAVAMGNIIVGVLQFVTAPMVATVRALLGIHNIMNAIRTGGDVRAAARETIEGMMAPGRAGVERIAHGGRMIAEAPERFRTRTEAAITQRRDEIESRRVIGEVETMFNFLRATQMGVTAVREGRGARPIDARQNVNITVNEATDATSVRQQIDQSLRDHADRQVRQLQQAIVPGGS
jgi:hypothetical protein